MLRVATVEDLPALSHNLECNVRQLVNAFDKKRMVPLSIQVSHV